MAGPESLKLTHEDRERAMRRVVWAWAFGSMFFSITTGAAFTSLLKKFLQISDFQYGLVMAAGPAAVLFTLLGSYWIERTGRSKPIFLRFLLAARVSWLAIAAVPLMDGEPGSLWVVGTVGLAAFFSAICANVGGAGFTVWMSDLVPRHEAGAFFGQRARVGLAMMVAASSSVSFLLDRFGQLPSVYAGVFAFAAVVGAIDILLFLRVPEQPRSTGEAPPSLWEVVAIPWRNADFRAYGAYTALAFVAYSMFWPFLWPFCFEPTERHGLGFSLPLTNALIVVLPQLANAFTSPFWGRALDRFGPKPVLGFGSLTAIVLPIFWVFCTRAFGFDLNLFGHAVRLDPPMLIPLVSLIGGLSWPSIDQSLVYVQLHGFPEARRSAYVAANNVVIGLAATVGSALGGAIASVFEPLVGRAPWLPSWFSHYQAVFAASILLRLAAFALLFHRLNLESRGTNFEAGRAVFAEALLPIRRLLPRSWTYRAR